jgi:hypothetical protein
VAQLLGVPILLLSVVASNPRQEQPLLQASTSRPLNAFGSCFVRVQERGDRAWAFAPNDLGGTFTNWGARGASPYWLQFRHIGPTNRIRLFVAKDAEAVHPVAEAIRQCR